MAEQAELIIAPRTVTGKATKRLRKAGIIPANIFGHNQPSQAVQVEVTAFERLRKARATKNVLLLKIDNATPQMALIRHIEHDAISGKVLHIDFARVSLDERISVKVPLHFVGEAPGVKNEGGVLIHIMDALEVECLASQIVDSLDVDVSGLAEIDDILHARDVKLPENYTLVIDPNEPIVKVGATRAEVEVEAEAPTPEEAPAPTTPAETSPEA
jgi:large subunit ribosomal protein L25